MKQGGPSRDPISEQVQILPAASSLKGEKDVGKEKESSENQRG